MAAHSSTLNNVFTRKTFLSFLEGECRSDYSSTVSQYLCNSSCSTNEDAVRLLYRLLFTTHRNEYVYKNTLLNKLLLGRHSVNTSTAFAELPLARSIADFVLINGKAIVYEIKTDLDNFSRLDSQMHDYYSVFDHVCVVCSENSVAHLLERYRSTPVGIAVLTDRETISIRKECAAFPDHLDYQAIFNVLRKGEYSLVLERCGLKVPDTAPVFYYRSCLEQIATIPMAKLYPVFLSVLKERGSNVDAASLQAVPKELRLLGYISRIDRKQADTLEHFLHQPVALNEEASCTTRS